jgi:hypothetical protein
VTQDTPSTTSSSAGIDFTKLHFGRKLFIFKKQQIWLYLSIVDNYL